MLSGRGSEGLLDYWAILVRRRWIICLSVVILTLLALMVSFLSTPYYRATATLKIERLNPDILTFRDLAQVDYSYTAYTDYYRTQHKIISSDAVSRLAVHRAGLLDHPEFSSESIARKRGLLSRLLALLPSRKADVEITPEDAAAARITSGLEVLPLRNSHLVNISWVAPSPDLAATVANAVAEAYVRFNIESQYSTSDQAEEFLVSQTAQLKAEIREIEEDLLQYGEDKSIVSIDDASNITLQALEDIARRRTAAQTQLAKTEAHFRSVMDSPAEGLLEVLNSSLIATLRREHAEYEAELSEYSRQFKDGWPGMQTLQSKLDQSQRRLEFEIQRIASQVRASAKAAYGESANEFRNYDELLKNQEHAAQRVRRDAVEYANLQSEVDKKRETLNALIGRQNEMALSSRLKDVDSSTNILIMEPARPPAQPFKPRTQLNIMLGLVFGLGLGIGLALLLDYLDNTINSVDDLAKITEIPMLAVIPKHGDKPVTLRRSRRNQAADAAHSFDLIAHLASQATASEAYRELRTSILLSNPGSPPRRIVVTSATPNEGKTATAVNLATVLAQLGKRVVLVDTDLRRPRLHEVFSIENNRGVSNYLSGLEQDPATLLLPTPIENLAVLPSGPIPPNPSELLNSPVFEELSERLIEQGFDHIVFDSPPALSVSDPVIIASVVESGVLVVRAGRTARQSVKMAAEKLAKSKTRQLGIVLNDLDLDSLGSPYQYYHRYAGPDNVPQEHTKNTDPARGATA